MATANAQSALDLARHGFAVFPVHSAIQQDGRLWCSCRQSDCSSPAKHPVRTLVPRGVHDASTDPAQIERWFSARQWLNVAVSTRSLVVLDIDTRHNGDEALARLEEKRGPLPQTWRTLTGGGGEHIWFRAPLGVTFKNDNRGILGGGIDVKTDGGYVLVPPSLHLSGRRYEWSVDNHPDETDLAAVPEWLVALLQVRNTPDARRHKREELETRTALGVQEGGRNKAITSLAGHLIARDVYPRIALELCWSWNQTHCLPPLSEREVIKTVESVCRMELARREGRRHAR